MIQSVGSLDGGPDEGLNNGDKRHHEMITADRALA
jgi:hypothetical protein